MNALLFGGSIFPNQTALEEKHVLNVILEFIYNKFNQCYDCHIEGMISLLVLFFCVILGIYFILSSIKK